MDYTITKDDIFLTKCVMYERRENDYLIRKPLDPNEEYRVVLFFCGKVIDFATADDIAVLPIDKRTNEITGRIEADTYYIEEAYEYTQISDKELEYVPTLLQTYQEKKLAEKNRRLLKFPKKILN